MLSDVDLAGQDDGEAVARIAGPHSASPAAYDRSSPNWRSRSISPGSKTGNICSRRVSTIDCIDTPLVLAFGSAQGEHLSIAQG